MLDKLDKIVYITNLSTKQCMENIFVKPWIYHCRYGTELWYRCDTVGDSRLILTFTGGVFRKMMRTTFIVDIKENGCETEIVLTFHKEILGLPALTPVSDIDEFMKQKADAKRQRMELK